MKIWAKLENNEVTYFKQYQAANAEEPENNPNNGAALFEISDEIELFGSRKHKYRVEGNTLVYDETKLSHAEKLKELEDIKKWFLETDYMINKVFIGEWENTDPRWLEYLETRVAKRARQDELLR